MTDKSGVFKNLGLGVTQGNELWAKDFNAAGGVCGRQVKLEEVDHGYKADTAKTLYPQIDGAPGAWAQGATGAGIAGDGALPTNIWFGFGTDIPIQLGPNGGSMPPRA